MPSRIILPVASLLVIALITFGPTITHDFILFDDNVHLFENPHLQQPLQHLARFWHEPYFGMYIPLTYTAWAIETAWARAIVPGALEGFHPWVYHLWNIAFHLLNSCLVLALLLKLVPSKSRWPAWVGAVIFAVHPLQAESVAWISGFKDVLSTSLGLLAILQFLRFSEAKTAQERSRSWVLGSLLFLLSLLAKPSWVVLPVVMGALEFLWFKRRERYIYWSLVPWLILSVPFVLLTLGLQPPTKHEAAVPWILRPLVALDAVNFYLYQFLIPLRLCMDYGRNAPWLLQQPWVYFSWFPLAALIAWRHTKAERTTAALGVFVLSLLPVLGLLSFRYQQFSTTADRYMYFPMVFLALAVTGIVSRGVEKNVPRTAAFCVAVILPLVILGNRQARNWKDSVTIFRHTLEINPDSIIAHNNLANTYEREEKFEQAYYHYDAALRLKPKWLDMHYNVAGILMRLGRSNEALPHLRYVLSESPNDADAHFLMGTLFLGRKDFKKGIQHFQRAIQGKPKQFRFFDKLGVALVEAGQLEDAVSAFRRAVELNPLRAESWNNLGVAYMRQKNWPRAMEALEQAVTLSPQYMSALNNLAECKMHAPTF